MLTKRLTPTIISGFIINDAHSIRGSMGRGTDTDNSHESFLATFLKKENPAAFIKCFTSSPSGIIRGGQNKLEKIMKSLQVDQLYCYPRIQKDIAKTLNDLPNMEVIEHTIEFSNQALEIHGLLYKLLEECVNELKRELGKMPLEDKEALFNEVLKIQFALLKSFKAKLRISMGFHSYNQLGFKSKALMANIENIKSLIFSLQNRSCITFYIAFKSLRFGERESDHVDSPMQSTFSIFNHCDEATNKIIEKILALAKKRVYLIHQRDAKLQKIVSGEVHKHADGRDQSLYLSESTKSYKFCSIEKDYGMPCLGFAQKWNYWRERAMTSVNGLQKFEIQYDLEVNYEQMPKLLKIVQILEE